VECLIRKLVEVYASGSLKPAIEIHITWSVHVRFSGSVLSC
jgi:hypothetical protein